MSVDFNTILSDGTAHIIFNDFLGGDSRLPCVSRTWRAAFAETGENFRAQLELRDVECVNATRQESEQVCNGRPVETVLAELMVEVGGKVAAAAGEHLHMLLELSWSGILAVHHAYSSQDPAARDEVQARRLVNCLHRVNAQIALVQNRDDLTLFVREFLAQEKLAQRAKSILQQGDLEFRHALYKGQERFNLPMWEQRDFESESGRPRRAAFSLQTFLYRERLGVAAEYYQELALRYLWIEIRARMNQGPDELAPVHEIRDWINNPANAGSLSLIHDLAIRLLCVVPAEIGKLNALRSLRITQYPNCNYRAANLPDGLRTLENLQELVLENVTSFREIPQVLEDLPALSKLTITRNDQPIRVFPSWLDNKINSGFSRGLSLELDNEEVQLVRFNRFLGLQINRPMQEANAIWNRQYAGFSHEEFTDIPFNIWFRENFSIPNFGVYALKGWIEFFSRLWKIPEFYNQGWLELIRALTFPLIPTVVLLVFGMGFGFSLIALGVQESLASFLTGVACGGLSVIFNPIFHNTIGRLAEAIYVAYEEGMGVEDPHMIHVRDLPEPQLVAVHA